MTNRFSRRNLLRASGSVAVASAAGTLARPAWADVTDDTGGKPRVEVEDLGPGNVDFPSFSGALVGDVMYAGSRNLSPTRVAGFHVPSRQVVSTFTLGNGDFVDALAADGNDILYAGVTHAADDINLYRCDLRTGDVVGLANVPGLFIRDMAVASDGTVYIVGRPRPPADGPPVYRYDPIADELVNIGIPEPDADQGTAVAVTDSTVYYGCGSSLTGFQGKGVFAIDRTTGAVTRLLDQGSGNGRLRVFGDRLVNGGDLRILDIEQGGDWQLTDLTGVQGIVRDGDDILAVNQDGLHRVSLATLDATLLGTPGAGANGMDLFERQVVGSASGEVWIFDLASGEGERHNLVSAGAEGDPQLGMSVAAGDDKVYVGGNGSVDVHDLRDGSVTSLDIGGEVKDMIAANGTMYMGVYARGQVWEHPLDNSEPPQMVAQLPDGHRRPWAVRWDDVNELVALGVQADSTNEGSLCVYNPATKALAAHINPVGSQPVGAVATGHGLVYIGGYTSSNTVVAAWDPVAGEEVWQLLLRLNAGVSSLVIRGKKLYGITRTSRFFVVDLASEPQLVHDSDVSAVAANNSKLVIDRGLIYGGQGRSVFRIDPVTYKARVLVDDLDGEWFSSGSRLTVDEEHNLYTLSGRELVRIRDARPRHETAVSR